MMRRCAHFPYSHVELELERCEDVYLVATSICLYQLDIHCKGDAMQVDDVLYSGCKKAVGLLSCCIMILSVYG